MTTIGRALMARPQTILLDEPSMGLAPQLVEEIFEIVKELNKKEEVSFLLAEQNTNIALHYDKLETRSSSAREKALMAALPRLLTLAKKAPGWARILKDVKPQAIKSREALAALPVTRKSELGTLQKEMP